jgi:23S rRNA U2552 (ribose-2'-O)-methylase RlmE/FtsJ
MLTVSYTDCADEGKTAVRELLSNLVVRIYENNLNHAFVHHYLVDDAQTKQIQTYLSPRIVHQAVTGALRFSSHPVLAVLNSFANEVSRDLAEEFVDQGYTVMTMGDSVNTKITASSHNCLLLDTNRELSRIVMTSNSKSPSSKALKDYSVGKTNTCLTCHSGCQNCSYQADILFAVHSAYDLSSQDIIDIFNNHSLEQMFVWIYTPASFFDPKLVGFDEKVFSITQVGEKIRFTMGDFSTPYVHDKKNWQNLCTTSVYQTPNFTITMEYMRTHGPLALLHFTKTRPMSGNLFINFPLTKLVGDYVFVPCMLECAEKHFAVEQRSLHHYLVPSHVATYLMTYTARVNDEGYSYTELAVVGGGMLRSLKIGNVTYADRWNVSPREFHAVTISLFILGAINRAERTTTISKAFEHLKSWRKNDGLYYEIRNTFYKFVNCLPTFAEKRFDSDDSTKRLWHMNVLYPQDYTQHKQFNGASDKPAAPIVTPLPPLSKPPAPHVFYIPPTKIKFKWETEMARRNSMRKLAFDFIWKRRCLPYDRAVVCFDDIIPRPYNAPHAFNKTRLLIPRKIPAHRDVRARDDINIPYDAYRKENDTDSINDINIGPFDRDSEDYTATTESSLNSVTDELLSDIDDTLGVNDALYTRNAGVPTTETPNTSTIDAAYKRSVITTTFSINADQVDLQVIDSDSSDDSARDLTSMVQNGPPNIYTDLDLDIEKDYILLRCVQYLPEMQCPERANNYKFNTIVIPRTFIPGHCIMSALWHCLPHNNKPRQSTVIRRVYLALCNMYNLGADIKLECIQNYIVHGTWQDMDAQFVVLALVVAYACNIEVNGTTGYKMSPKTYGFNAANGTHKIYYNGKDHYSALPSGGTKDKFTELIRKIGIEKHTVLELSCAPGSLMRMLLDQTDCNLVAAHYSPGIPVDMKGIQTTKVKCHLDASYVNATAVTRSFKILPYKNYEHLYTRAHGLGDYDVVICDAAAPVCSENIINNMMAGIKQVLKPGCTLVVKHFSPLLSVSKLAVMFDETEVWQDPDNKKHGSVERYTIMRGYRASNNPEVALRDIHNPLNEFLCTAVFEPDKKKLITFIDYYFEKIGTHNLQEFRGAGLPTRINFEYCAGYASAGKTTKLIEMMNDEYNNDWVFVAPTRKLMETHVEKGAVSYTQHNIFDTRNKYKCIVIDEFSCFFAEYLALISIRFPGVRIIIAGDVYQTPAIAYNTRVKYTTFADLGIDNNLTDVYAVPQDIAALIRNKLGYAMHSTSEVQQGLFKWTDAIDKLKGFQFICFNDSTQKQLQKDGYRASTITTYQGSRDRDVVFYIDDKAIHSSLTSRTQWVYTAMTRGTHSIILYGNTQILEAYFNIHGTKIPTYSFYSNLDVVTDQVPTENSFENTARDFVKAEPAPAIAKDNCPMYAAAVIASEVRTQANEATASHMFLSPSRMPDVITGYSKVDPLMIQETHKTFTGCQLFPDIPFVKNQVSSDSRETVRTLWTRYTKRTPMLRGKKLKITTKLLMRGFCKALYGDVNSLRKLKHDLKASEDELRKCYRDYLISFNEKCKANPGAMLDIEKEFNQYDEILKFVNKKQSKYSEKEDWDSEDKVGQGVMSLSKRVNMLFSAYARCLLEKVRAIAKTRNRNIIFATHGSDEQLSDEIAALMAERARKGEKWFLCDVSEWDASFNDAMAGFSTELVRMLGGHVIGEYILEWFKAFRSSWHAVIASKAGKCTLDGTSKQFSGNPFTIVENTLCNAALMNAVFDFHGHALSIFKGDDSAIYCMSTTFTSDGEALLGDFGHKLKSSMTDIGEFAGYFITELGLFPDVVRRSCRFLGAVYRNEAHFLEAKTNVKNCCSTVKSQEQVNLGCAMTALHYEGKITHMNAINLFNFCRNIDDVHWSKLMPIRKPILRS